ncbi:MAG: DUF3017 domain-containing protein [bacterium]
MSAPTRRDFRTRDLHNVPYLAVLVAAGAGLAYSAAQPVHWLRGIGVVGLAMGIAGLLRWFLTDRQAGLLAVRRRMFDVCCYFMLSGGILGVALVLPH